MPVRLALGTAQLGLDYGVGNAAGRPSPAEAARILAAACRLGVRYIDTAAAYGDAELVLGRILREQGRPTDLRIGTKLPALPPALTPSELGAAVSQALEDSRRRLGTDVDDLLVHAAANLREYGVGLLDALEAQVRTGRVRRVGVSIYEQDDVSLVLAYPGLSVTQFPFSVFNRGLGLSRSAAALRAAGHETFARSVLQQGLLALDAARAEAAVPGTGPWLERFVAACAGFGVTPVAAAVGYAAVRSGADALVVGIESAPQLEAVVAAAVQAPPDGLVQVLDEQFGGVPAGLRDPRTWRGGA